MAPHVLRDFEMVRSEYGLRRKVGHADEGHARADPWRVPCPDGRPCFALFEVAGNSACVRVLLRTGALSDFVLVLMDGCLH